MLRFRKALLCDYLYYAFFAFAILFTIFHIQYPKESFYTEGVHEVVGTIVSIKEKDDWTTYQIKAKEKILATTDQKNVFQLGDQVLIKGTFEKPESSFDRDLWDYSKYLSHQQIYYIVRVDSISIIKKNKNFYYRIKQVLINLLHQNPYLHTFILGDKTYLEQNVIRSYQENGISHLFAISGMHITLLANLFERLLKNKIQEENRFKVISIFLLLYLCLVGFSPSMVRGVGFYLLFRGNQIYYFYIKKEHLFLFMLSLSLLMNPFYIYDIGFQYSYLISYSLLRMSSELNATSKWKSLLKVSLLSFFVSVPITLMNYNQLNFLSIIYNLFYVSYVSSVVFPLSLVVLFIRPLEPIYNVCTLLLEKTSLFLSQIRWTKFYWKQMPTIVYLLYFGIIIVYLSWKKKWLIYLFLFLLIVHFLFPYFRCVNDIKFLNVGQGDSTFLKINHKNILIDTGGKGDQGVVFYNALLPSLKKMGVQRIHYLILTHGDFDHMGDAIYLVNNFKVEKVIFNCGEFNDLEQELIQVLDKKKVKYYLCIKELNIDNNKLYFLQTKEYDNENDNSNVIYTELGGYKFMFMGDAGIEKEKDILDQYNINDIDVLKVGHHGSKTSSSKDFIDEINPKYSIISVGNNKYGHPNKEVLNILEGSKIYRTDQDGSIMFQIKDHKMIVLED